jgi:hypothetical protein
VDAKHLCDDCPEPCTLEEGVHSPGRAALLMDCGTQEREIAFQLMRRWRGTGGQLLAVARAAAR